MAVPEHSIYYQEIVTPDGNAVRENLEKSHGWTFQPADPVLGYARVASMADGSMVGIRAPMHPTEKPMVRVYVRVGNVKGAVENAKQRGAKVLLERMELPGRGVIAIYELGGIEQGVWQLP